MFPLIIYPFPELCLLSEDNQFKCKVMKKVLLLLSVFTFILFTSCEKDAEPEPYSLATDLQNGYWVYYSVSITVVQKFDGTNVTVYIICEEVSCAPNFPCILVEDVFPYTLEGDVITIDGGSSPIKIEDDILTSDVTNVLQRTLTFNYSDCN
jgi:hypothetical protein